jgi:hypothetical protein
MSSVNSRATYTLPSSSQTRSKSAMTRTNMVSGAGGSVSLTRTTLAMKDSSVAPFIVEGFGLWSSRCYIRNTSKGTLLVLYACVIHCDVTGTLPRRTHRSSGRPLQKHSKHKCSSSPWSTVGIKSIPPIFLETIMVTAERCRSSLPEDVISGILSHLTLQSIIRNKLVCRSWRRIGTDVIDAKRTQAFLTNQELSDAVEKYLHRYDQRDPRDQERQAENCEEIAQTYGWPIGKWDVSRLTDF